MRRLKRNASFGRFLSISGEVDAWFHESDSLASAMSAFAEQHAHVSTAFQPEVILEATPPSEPQVEGRLRYREARDHSQIDHAAHDAHAAFCSLVEQHVEAFLGTKNVTMEQFQEAYRITQQEERRDGQHFYRWMEAIEFEVFFVLMSRAFVGVAGATTGEWELHGDAGVRALRERVQRISSDALKSFRRRKEFVPLLALWCPQSFAEIDKVLKLTRAAHPHNLPKSTLKSLARWRLRLTMPISGPGGYQTAPPRDEEAWASYLATYSEKMEDAAFAGFMSELREAAEKSGESQKFESDSDRVALQDRRVCWRAFLAFDTTHRGKVGLNLVIRLLHNAHVFQTKTAERKLQLRWTEKLKQAQQDERRANQSNEDNGFATNAALMRVRSPTSPPQELTLDPVVAEEEEDDGAGIDDSNELYWLTLDTFCGILRDALVYRGPAWSAGSIVAGTSASPEDLLEASAAFCLTVEAIAQKASNTVL